MPKSATLLPYDLTAGGSLYPFHGHTDIKEFAAYAQDAITAGPWSGNFGLRFDQYNGLTVANQVEPRLASLYKVKRTGTVLRLSYARTLESPFNENLILASEGCDYAVIATSFPAPPHPTDPASTTTSTPIRADPVPRTPALRRLRLELHPQRIRLLRPRASAITFPIGWHNSKIPGFDGRLDVPPIHNFTAQIVFSSVAARFFTPQTSGLGTIPTPARPRHTPFRIDHDEKFNQTTHAQYQLGRAAPMSASTGATTLARWQAQRPATARSRPTTVPRPPPSAVSRRSCCRTPSATPSPPTRRPRPASPATV